MILEPLNLNRLLSFLPDHSRFNLMDVFYIGNKELAHSNFIKYLLEKNHIDIFGAQLFLEILKKHKVLGEEVNTNCSYFKIHREFHNIDILIECPAEKLIVAIENKLYSPEGEKQLQRYQGLLNELYPAPDHKKYLLFLTPSGRNALTADEDNRETLCMPISYEIIIELIERVMECTEKESYKVFLGIMKEHLGVNVVTNKELKQEIHKVWGDPEQRKILNLVNDNRPGLGYIKDSYIKKAKDYVSSVYNDELLVLLHPDNGILKQIKLSSKILSGKGINIRYMLFDYKEDDYPCFRVVIDKDEYYDNKDVYEKVVKVLSDSYFAKISEIQGWSDWMSLLLEDNSQPDRAFKDKHEYGEDFAIIAFDVFKFFYDKVNRLLYEKF